MNKPAQNDPTIYGFADERRIENASTSQASQADIHTTPLNHEYAVNPLESNNGVQPKTVEEQEHSGLEFLSIDRGEHAYEAAQRHSGYVKFWKMALPATGFVIILGISGALLANSMFAPEAEVASISLDDGNLVMENPELNGFDKNQRAYSLTALRAVQDVANPTRIALEKISAELPIDDTVSASIDAGNGIYDAELKTLILDKKIEVTTTSGLRLNLDDANIDIGEGVLSTSGAVVATSPQADISADSLSVSDNGNRIVFNGTVRMVLRPGKLQNLSDK